MLAAQTLEQAWHVIVGWGLPTSDAEKALLVRQLETVQMEVGEDPKIYFARVDKLLNTLKSVGIVKEEREIVRITIRNLYDEYMVEKRSHLLTMPNISRFEVEETVRASYANHKYSDLGKLSVAVPTKAPPTVVINDPHALAWGPAAKSWWAWWWTARVTARWTRTTTAVVSGVEWAAAVTYRWEDAAATVPAAICSSTAAVVSGVEWTAAVTRRWADAAATIPAAICSSTAAAICSSTAAAAAATVSAAIRSAAAAVTLVSRRWHAAAAAATAGMVSRRWVSSSAST